MTTLLPAPITETQVSIPPRDHIPCCQDNDKALCGLDLHDAPWAPLPLNNADLCPLCDLANEDGFYCPSLPRCIGKEEW